LSPLIALIDIETKPQDFVLELKRIQIPGHPFAFNASIVRWKGTLLMSYWQVEEPCLNQIASAAVSRVGLVWLDDDFNPIGDPYSLDFGTPISRAQDLRLVEAGDDLYIVYNDNLDEVVTEGGFRMWTGKLDFDGLQFQIFDLQELKYYDWENPRRREKSWIPFDYQGGLHLAYSISPHLIFRTFDGTSCCQSIAVTQPDLHWRWGEPRGGTPAIQIKEGYLSFFHSSIYFPSVHSDGLVVPHYFMGAYIFSKKPPFEIKRVSPRPIIAKGFYSGETYPYYWKPICVVFPCGILVEKKYIWITYGRQDHEIWVAKIDRKKLLKSLIPIGQKPLPSKWDSWKGLCGND
jgi:predicted GH43/DUF377 family glycosyl hydrolase